MFVTNLSFDATVQSFLISRMLLSSAVTSLDKACLRKNANFVKHRRFQHFLTTYSKILRHISPALFMLNLKMSLILILGAKLAEIFESEYKEEKILHLLSQRKIPFLGIFEIAFYW